MITDYKKIEDKVSQSFEDKYPFLMFPVRLETRFMKVIIQEHILPADGGPPKWALNEGVISILDLIDNIKLIIKSDLIIIGEEYTASVGFLVSEISQLIRLVASERGKIEFELSKLETDVRNKIIDGSKTFNKNDSQLSDIPDLIVKNDSFIDDVKLKLTDLNSTTEQTEVDDQINVLLPAIIEVVRAEVSREINTPSDLKDSVSVVIDSVLKFSTLLTNKNTLFEDYVNDVNTWKDELAAESLLFTEKNNTSLVAEQNKNVALQGKIDLLESNFDLIKGELASLPGKERDVRVNEIPDEITPGQIKKIEGAWGIVDVEITELWVRIYPDDISITAHERELQESEIKAGVNYWLNLWEKGRTKEIELGLWRTLVDVYGARRAAWVVKVTEPTNLGLLPTQIQLDANIQTLVEAGIEATEYQRGVDYWLNLIDYLEDVFLDGIFSPSLQKSLWENLVVDFGDDKSLVIINLSRPTNLSDYINGIISKDELVFQENGLEKAIVSQGFVWNHFAFAEFPNIAKKSVDQPWVNAAYTDTMPSNFIITTYANEADSVGTRHVGKNIPSKLITGFHADDTKVDSITLTNSGDLEFEDDIKWMTDFEEAVDKGMALRIPLTTDEETDGFYRVFATGIKEDVDSLDGKKIIENLFESHHYSEEGIALIPQGTATNNTQESEAGLSSFDFGAEESFEVERGGELFQDQDFNIDRNDGQWLAEALGIDSSYFKHIQHADSKDISTGMLMNQALFMGSINTYMEYLLPEIFQKDGFDTIHSIRDFFTEYVSASGFIPSIKVGNQPYGILAASSSLRSEYGWDIPIGSYLKDFEVYIDKFYTWWLREADREPNGSANIDGGVNYLNKPFGATATETEKIEETKRRFLNILGLNPNSVEHHLRYGLSGGALTNLGGMLQLSQNNYLKQNIQFLNSDLGLSGFISDKSPIFSLLYGVDSTQRVDLGNDGNFKGGIVQEGNLSEIEGLDKIFDTKTKNYIEKILKSPFTELRSELYSGSEVGNNSKSMLYLMLRHSLLLQYFDTCMELLDQYFYYEYRADINEVSGKFEITNFEYKDKNQDYHPANDRVFTKNAVIKVFLGEDEIATLEVDQITNTGTITNYIEGIQQPNGQHIIRVYDNYGFQIRANLGGVLHKDITDTTSADGEIINQIKHMIKPISGLVEKEMISPIDFLQKNNKLSGIEDVRKYLDKVIYSIEAISKIPTAKLERAFIEHVDLFTYRLDAWKQALVNYRYRTQRREHGAGIYIGAFGWVEDLRPKDSLSKLPEEDYPIGYNVEEITLYQDTENEGYIHAPSINHGVASAVLKSAYASIADSNNDSLFAVNLSSQRVRRALAVFEGIRNGQTMAEVLGYQFERYLHDSDIGIQLEQYLYEIREAFPLQNDLPENGISESVKPRNSVDGLAIIQIPTADLIIIILSWIPQPNTNEQKELLKIVDEVKGTFDAVKDLAMSEGIYGAAMGNMDNPSAMMTALSEGSAPPDPEIINTPRNGYRLTNKVISIIDSFLHGTNLRALIEPYINKWVKNFIGDTPKIVCNATYDGGNLEVSVFDLQLDALDLIYIINKSSTDGSKDLDKLIAYYVKSTNELADDVVVTISYIDRSGTSYESDTSFITIGEVIPLVERLYKVITNSKYLTAEDVRSPDIEKFNQSNPGNINIKKFKETIEGIKNYGTFGLSALDTALTNSKVALEANVTTSTINDLRIALLNLFRIGVKDALPQSSYGDGTEIADLLVVQASNIEVELKNTISEFDSIMATVSNDDLTLDDIEKLLKAAKSVFGEDYRVLPKFDLDESNKFDASLNNTNSLLDFHDGDFVMEDWLNGVSHVKEKVKVFNDVFLTAEMLNIEFDSLKPVQLPHYAKDFWLGLEYPSEFEVDEAKISLAVLTGDDFDEDLPQCGFVIDEWVEIIPAKDVTTAVTYHYDEPIAEAPNALLLAISPNLTDGKWDLDDILNIMKSTFDDMKLRAVEPDILDNHTGNKDGNFYSKSMPPIVNSALPDQRNFTLDFGGNLDNPLLPRIDYSGAHYDDDMLDPNIEGNITI